MRSLATAIRELLAAQRWRCEGRVFVENPDGVMQDVTDFLGANWLDNATWTEDADQPVASGVVTLIREDTDLSISLAPAIGASPANRNAANEYAPFLKEGRDLIIEAAFTEHGVPAIEADFVEVMRGRIDYLRQNLESNEIRLEFRDPGAVLLDFEIVDARDYATNDAGMLIEDVLQAVLDDNHGAGAYALYVPKATGTVVKNIRIEPGKELERLRDVAMSIGFELRYKYDAAGVMRLTLYEPERVSLRRVVWAIFDAVAGALLSAYVGTDQDEIGWDFTKHPGVAGDAEISNADRIRNSGAAASLHYASGTPPSEHYDVSATIVRKSATTGSVAVVGRLATAALNGYAAEYTDNGDEVRLYRLDPGGPVLLASVAQALAIDEPHELTLSMHQDTIRALWDDVEVLSVVDATYTAAGRAGLYFREAVAGGDAIGLHVDDFALDAVDALFRKSEYTAIPRLDIGIGDVRNYIRVDYTDIATGQRAFVELRDQPSIDEYDERFAGFAFAPEGNINTEPEATRLGTAALSDLSTPYSDHDFETVPFFYPAQVGDIYEVEANGVVYDSNQIFGVKGFTHTLRADGGETRFVTKGKVVGAVKEWIRRARVDLGDATDEDDAAEAFRVRGFHEIGRTPLEVTFGWENDVRTKELWLWLYTYDQPVPSSPDPRPNLSSPNPIRLTPDTVDYTIPIPPIGKVTYGLLVPFDAAMQPGDGEEITVHALDAIPLINGFAHVIGAGVNRRDVSFYVLDPAGLGGTLRVWTNHEGADDANPDGAIEGTLAIAATPFTVDPTDVFTLTVGGTSALMDEIKVHPGRGKRIFAEFINASGISSGLQSFVLLSPSGPVDDANELIAGIINSYTPFANTLRPVKLLAALPGSGSFVGEMVMLTSDTPPKLYRWSGTAWVAHVPAADITGTINTAQIADDAITAQKIGDLAVQTAHLAVGAVDANKIADDAVQSVHLALGAVDANAIAAAAVGTVALATGAVTNAILAASAVTETKIDSNAVTTPKIVAGAITTGKIATGAVTANEIAALTITAGNIAAGAIVTAKLAAGAVTANEIAALTILAGNIAAGAIVTAKLAAGAVTANEIAALTITAAQIAAGTITGAKVAAGTITAGNIAALTITAAEIAALTITAAQIAVGSIDADRLVANSITAGQIAAGAIATDELAADAVTAAKIGAGQVTAAKISVTNLAAISTSAGIIVSGKLQNSAGTHYLDLDASGTGGFLVHSKLTLRANGNAEFGGDVTLTEATSAIYFRRSDTTLTASIETYHLGTPVNQHGMIIYVRDYSGTLTSSLSMVLTDLVWTDSAGSHVGRITTDLLRLWDSGVGGWVDVTYGAANSGGAGYRLLRVPN
jgi:hypothetical protein